MTGHAKIIDMRFEEEHFNFVCNATIPESYMALVEADFGYGYETMPKVCGHTPQEIVDGLKEDFSKVTASAHIHQYWLKNDCTTEQAFTHWINLYL